MSAVGKNSAADEQIKQLAAQNNPLDGWWSFLSHQLDCWKGPCKDLKNYYVMATDSLDEDALKSDERYVQIWLEYAQLLR